MRLRLAGLLLVASSTVVAAALTGPIPPGRQHRMTIEGENTITFLPQLNMPDVKVDYVAKFEYIVDSRYGKEPKPTDDKEKDEDESTEPAVAKTSVKKAKAKTKKAENPGSRATGAIDVSLHSSERVFRQNGVPIVEMKVSRSKFQGRPQPEMPIFDVTAANAPVALLEIMKGFDVISASLLLNDDLKVVNRKYLRSEGPQRALVDTMLSIHTPVPRNADSWEAPTQLVMGHGQTAKGLLRFEKIKPVLVASIKEKDAKEPGKPPESTLVKVKVSGVLKAEGVVAGRFIKDGTYNVTGEQTFDMRTHDWINARWSVVVDNELANANGQTVARAKGTMTVQSQALEVPKPTESETPTPKR
jgi:hypothetical protein